MRIIVAGRLVFTPGSDCAEMIRSAAPYILASRAEDGCVAYDWAVDPIDDGAVHVYEEWESEAALGRHFKDPSYQAMRAHLGQFKVIGFTVKLYSVAGVEPVYTEDGQPRDAIFGVNIA